MSNSSAVRPGPHRAKRAEAAVFGDLAELCSNPGYVHALAYICHRDNFIAYDTEMKSPDMAKLFTRGRLIRTEITTLIGLVVQQHIDLSLPEPVVMQSYIDRTDALMDELHAAIGSPMFENIHAAVTGQAIEAASHRGAFLREPIFYGGESAYSFQYRDFSPEKYGKDDEWLQRTKGFSIQAATAVVRAIGERQNENVMAARQAMPPDDPASWTILPGFFLSAEELVAASGVALEEVQAVLQAFTHRGHNTGFTDASAFNAISATPLIPLPDGRVLLYQYYSLVEALYESPFYWMLQDDSYKNTASRHRGEFTEAIAVRCFAKVFGAANVRSNIDVYCGKQKAGEIDVLVTFGDRVIVVQAKSKRLTLEARRGNDGQIKADFQKAVVDAYEQGMVCARHILAGDSVLRDPLGNEVVLQWKPKEVFLLNVVADHYPALSFQVSQFLKHEATEGIRPPFVMDVFLLDAMTEMLESPLRLLSYIHQRSLHADRLQLSHELVALSFHLKENLWLSAEHDMVILGDDISADLDLAMMVRRDGVPGDRTPDGILTRFAGTAFERLMQQIEQKSDPATLDLGFLLLTLGEDTCRHLTHGIQELARRAKADGKPHDFTLSIDEAEEGICLHCNPGHLGQARARLEAHCHKRKYALKARKWFGLCLHADESIRLGLALDYPWQPSDDMDRLTQTMRSQAGRSTQGPVQKWPRAKIGRNDPCPCGSGLKYKKCHLDVDQ